MIVDPAQWAWVLAASFAGAVIGAVMALGTSGPFSLENVDKAMKFLESGLQLD